MMILTTFFFWNHDFFVFLGKKRPPSFSCGKNCRNFVAFVRGGEVLIGFDGHGRFRASDLEPSESHRAVVDHLLRF